MPNIVQLIQMPHRCGHGIVPLPETIKPYINTTLAWDNIDRLEETLSGAGNKKPLARLNLTFLSVMRFHSYCSRGSSEVPQDKEYAQVKEHRRRLCLNTVCKGKRGTIETKREI